MARLRSAPSTQSVPPPASRPNRQALKEKTNTAKAKVPVYEDDGNTEDLVKNARPKRGKAKGAAQNEDAFVMTGGLGQRELERQSMLQSEPQITDELAKSDAPAPPPAKVNRRPPRTARKVVQTEGQNKMFEDMKRRMEATARHEAPTKRAEKSCQQSERSAPSSDALPTKPPPARKSNRSLVDRSEFSLSPSPPPPGKLSSIKGKRSSMAQPSSALKAQGTPAVETSILALKNFKRRPRQPSMLQMVQKATASARPSAAHVQATEDPIVFDIDDVQDDDEEFAPEAEGTPLHVSKAKQPPAKGASKSKSRTVTATGPIAESKKRKSEDVDISSGALEALKAKRRKVDDAEQDEDPLWGFGRSGCVANVSPGRLSTPPAGITSDVQVINSSPSSTPPTETSSSIDQRRSSRERDVVVPSTEFDAHDVECVHLNDVEDEVEQDVPNGTMAEPASSSPLPSDPVRTQRTDIMADPLTQVSPPRPPPEKIKKKSKQKPMTTAALQSMLPKRRQSLKPRARQSEYDVESDSEDDNPLDTSHLAEDVDELGGKRRRQTKSVLKGRKSTAVKPKARQSTAALKARMSSAPPARKPTAPSTTKKGKKPAAKTYGRGETSDKENEDDGYESLDENDESALPDTSISMIEAAHSKELEQAKRKFEDIDDWDMEFESMSVEEGRSSSQQWR